MSRLRMLLNRFVFRQCELVIWVSHKQHEYWRARGVRGKRDAVIQNGIDADYFSDRSTPQTRAATRAEFGFAPSDFVVGLCAALRVEKAHGDLLRAIRRLRDSGIPAKALMIGDGQQRAVIESQIAELQLTGHAVITGHRNDVRPYIACCDVMTLTSHNVETFSIAALESMALGKPVVLTRVGGAEEQVQHGSNGFLFEPGDVAALAHLLRRLTAATDRLSMGATAARDVRARFTIQRMVQRFTEELERVTAVTGE
jgi:glycosyltransferase involved in cell wall biosynthesis